MTPEQELQFKCAQQRIGYLQNPSTLNALFDVFQSDGMPMGSDRWAEFVHTRYAELVAKERTLRMLMVSVNEMVEVNRLCGSRLHIEQRRRLTEEFQARPEGWRQAQQFPGEVIPPPWHEQGPEAP